MPRKFFGAKIDIELKKAVKAVCVDRDLKIYEVVEEALRMWLKWAKKEQING